MPDEQLERLYQALEIKVFSEPKAFVFRQVLTTFSQTDCQVAPLTLVVLQGDPGDSFYIVFTGKGEQLQGSKHFVAILSNNIIFTL